MGVSLQYGLTKVVGSNLVSSKVIDGNGVKAMPGSNPAYYLRLLFLQFWQKKVLLCPGMF
jgi:hypothetical protein